MLTKQNKEFCEYYVECYKPTDAYCKAYPTATRESARRLSSKLLQKEEVLEYISELQKAQFKAACITAERIGKQLGEIAFNDDGKTSRKDQLKALELLSKQIGLYTQKVEMKQEVIEIGLEDEDSLG